MGKTLLWLDDVRDPFEESGMWLAFAPITNPSNVIWVKSYDEFVGWIEENGLPDGIAFDHDLADEDSKEKTGMDCAKWLVEYCLDNDEELPRFSSQSANPPGRENIISLLTNFLKSQT